MYDLAWSAAEKKIARRVFDAALQAELAEIVDDFKGRAAAARGPDDVWAIEEHLTRKRRAINEKYDFRWSQMLLVFARLLREERIQEVQLAGLAEEKLSNLRGLASLLSPAQGPATPSTATK
jgi:hypothetical protein